MKAPELVVRRSRIISAMNFLMALILASAAIWYAITMLHQGEGSWIGAGMVVALLGFYAWQTAWHLSDKAPLIAIGPEGMRLPSATAMTIPWPAITRIGATRSFALVGGGRLDIEVTPEIFAQLKLGKRLFGDPVVKMVVAPFGISLIAQGLDHRASEIMVMVTQYWPPASEG